MIASYGGLNTSEASPSSRDRREEGEEEEEAGTEKSFVVEVDVEVDDKGIDRRCGRRRGRGVATAPLLLAFWAAAILLAETTLTPWCAPRSREALMVLFFFK